MKLITHNLLTSKGLKNVQQGYPLLIKDPTISKVEVDFNPEFIVNMLPKLDWTALKSAAESVKHNEDLPAEKPTEDQLEENEDLLRKIHHLLMEIEISAGFLECPESKRLFPITNGIPNMLLHEDEV